MKITKRRGFVRMACIACAVAGIWNGVHFQHSLAQSPTELKSLKLVPKDADFLYGSYRMNEQWDRFVSGPVVKSLMQLPSVEKALKQFRLEWKEREAAGSQVRVALENGNVKEVLAFLKEITSSELFIFGDKNFSTMSLRLAKINEEMSSILSSGDLDQDEITQQVAEKWIAGLDGMTFPTIVMGGRCDDTDLALGKIDQLEVPFFALRQIPDAAPYLSSLTRVEDSRGDRLQWVLSGSQIPWDIIPTNDTFDEEMRDSVKDALADASITFTIGLFDGHFIFAISPTPEALLAFGKGESILDHPDMKPFKDSLNLPLTGLSYSSDALADSTFVSTYKNFFSRNFANMSLQLSAQLEEDSEIRDFMEDVIGDFRWMDESIAPLVPPFRGSLSLTFLTEDGWERHDHLRTKNVLFDSSSKLAALEHVGGEPLMMTVSKMGDHPEYFQLMRKIVQKTKARFDEAIQLDWDELNINVDQDELKQKVEMVWPFLVRIADTWEKKFLPGMSGEHGVILSAGNLAATQWVKDMPPASEPLPLIEFATVTGLRNKELFQGGFEDLFAMCDDIVEMIRQQNPNGIPPNYTIPRPNKTSVGQADRFGYPIPEDCPVPKDMMPQMFFSGDFAFGTYSNKQAETLAKSVPLTIGKGIIDPSAKQGNASYVAIGKLFQFATPWVRYAVSQSVPDVEKSVLDESIPDDFAGYELTVKDLLDLYGVLGKIGDLASSTTSNESGGTITRSVYRSQK